MAAPANPIRRGVSEPQPAETQSPSDNLALLYQSVLTGIVRIQSKRQDILDGAVFRRRTKAALQEVERAAAATGYENRDVRDTHLAVVAFLDAVILHSKDSVRAEWERMPLALELLGFADAGVVFFEKLEQFRVRRDSPHLADILEVYLLCLLLGFEGRYSGGQRAQLAAIIDGLRMRIDGIRQRIGQLSPFGYLPETSFAVPPAPAKPIREPWILVTLALLVFSILFFVFLKWNLVSASTDLAGKLF